jgi:hypothetical protein
LKAVTDVWAVLAGRIGEIIVEWALRAVVGAHTRSDDLASRVHELVTVNTADAVVTGIIRLARQLWLKVAGAKAKRETDSAFRTKGLGDARRATFRTSEAGSVRQIGTVSARQADGKVETAAGSAAVQTLNAQVGVGK